jgi:hypothetical protein
MVEPLRHRQTKEAATDMFSLQQLRHISTLPIPAARTRSKNSEPFRRQTIVKSVTDRPIGA